MASTGIPLDEAAIISTVLEGILYGFSVLMFVGTIWALIYKPGTQKINRPITVVAILLLVLSTAHMVTDIIRVEDGLVRYRDTYPGGPVAFFQDISQHTYVIKNVILTLQTLLGDGVVIYRCYVVWRSVWVIILPSMMWCSVAVTGLTAAYYASQASSDGTIYLNPTGQWVTAFFSMTLSVNLISSGLLAYRIWTIEHNISAIRVAGGTMTHIMRVLVDAALLYSATLFPALICFVLSNNGQAVLADMITPIISIAFYMVFIRITFDKNTHNYSSMVRSAATSEPERGNSRQYPKPLQVHISRFTHTSHGEGNQDRKLTSETETMEEASCNA